MPRRRVPTPYHPKSRSAPSPVKTRFQLFTYAFSRLPPRQLPFLAAYARLIIYAGDNGWVDQKSLGKAGASIVGVLSMVTGLLLSYRFSSAVAKWDEGKQVWAAARVTIRDGMRMISISASPSPQTASSASPASTPVDLAENDSDDIEAEMIAVADPQGTSQPSSTSEQGKKSDRPKDKSDSPTAQDAMVRKVDELAGLLVGFAFALQHHLHGSRPLPQPPLCDLLPPGYLSSLKRTEGRVRFAESHAGPSGSTPHLSAPSSTTETTALAADGGYRPGLRRRGTGPPTREERESTTEDEWELGNLRNRAEEAVTRLAEAVASSGLGDEGADLELRQQLSQLNVPERDGAEYPFSQGVEMGGHGLVYRTNTQPASSTQKPKSNLHNPYPSNLPLALLKLMEAYVVGLANVEPNKGGWPEAKRERGLGIIKDLSGHLGEAERLSSNPPPLPLSLHLSHLLIIYLAALPCSLLCVVSGWSLVLITLVAGWCLLGLEALVGEVGGVFGSLENHHPLPMFTQQILTEALDISPSFLKYYRTRLINRLGEGEEEVKELDRRRRRDEDWLPSFA